MTRPAHSPRSAGQLIQFHRLIEEAQVDLARARKTATHALQIGVSPVELIDLARGKLTDPDRRELLSLLARSPWALSRVVALVRSARNPRSLGARILAASNTDPYAWGMKDTGDYDMDLCRLLEQIE